MKLTNRIKYHEQIKNTRTDMPVASDPFSDIVIRNSSGVICKPSQVFSRDKREEMNQFFQKNKRGPLARVHSLTFWSKSSGSSLLYGSVGVPEVRGLTSTESRECQLHKVTGRKWEPTFLGPSHVVLEGENPRMAHGTGKAGPEVQIKPLWGTVVHDPGLTVVASELTLKEPALKAGDSCQKARDPVALGGSGKRSKDVIQGSLGQLGTVGHDLGDAGDVSEGGLGPRELGLTVSRDGKSSCSNVLTKQLPEIRLEGVQGIKTGTGRVKSRIKG